MRCAAILLDRAAPIAAVIWRAVYGVPRGPPHLHRQALLLWQLLLCAAVCSLWYLLLLLLLLGSVFCLKALISV